jgi:hypothetical protein
MDGRKSRTDPETARSKKRKSRRGEAEETEHEGVLLSSVSTWIPTIYGADRPLVAALLSEDLCWCIAREDWSGRRPPLWKHAERAAWRDEGRLLEEKRVRIAEQAAELGFA